jgi:pyruvate formate lyase activating enzyme
LRIEQKRIFIQRDGCNACGLCSEACPSGALEILGKTWKADDLASELLKDRAYYAGSGGVTLGGGEPTLQPRFAAALLEKLQTEGIHTALDTCGMCSPSVLESLLPFTDLVLYDLKEIDPEKHRRFTDVPNETILENAVAVVERMEDHGHPREFWIRTPVIPGTTASLDNIRGIGSFIQSRLRGAVNRWDLCAFNNLCRDKYRRLDMPWDFERTELLTRDFMESMADEARRVVGKPEIVHWSGMVK